MKDEQIYLNEIELSIYLRSNSSEIEELREEGVDISL